jgi:hypothetical protein
VYDRVRLAGLCFSLKKSHFNYHRIKCLGHIITKGGRTPDPTKIQAIIDIAPPTEAAHIRHFLGLVAFNWDYIPNVSTLTQPIRALLSTPGSIVSNWKDEIHGKAFREIKHLLTTQPVMQLPDPSKPFRIHVDSTPCGYGCGAILLQRDDSAPSLAPLSQRS